MITETRRRSPTDAVSVLAVLAIVVTTSHCSPINRQAGISENVYITVQNDTYGNEQRVCSIESMTYEDGESIPTSSPCEHCICRPPGFACTIISCDYRPGCKALKRSNQCCPEYQCECEKDGKIYQNGEKILDDNNPCEVCYCQGGDVVCAVIDCYWRSDCQPRYIENRCCPLYDHCPPPSDVGPILPTTRPTTTTTTLPPISWFNVSQAALEPVSSSRPSLLPIASTEVGTVSEPESHFVQHVVLIPTPVEQSPPPAENSVQGSTSGEEGNSNEVPQASQEHESELPQIIIQPNDSGEQQQPEQALAPAAEPQPASVSMEAPVEVHVPDVPTESTLPVVAEGISQIRDPEPPVAVEQPVSVLPPQVAQDRTPEPPVPVSEVPPAAPAAPAVIFSEVEQGNEVVPPEVHPVPIVPTVAVEPSESAAVSSSVVPEESPSSFYQPSTPGPASTASAVIEASEVNLVESDVSTTTASSPILVTGAAQTQEQQTFTPISSQQIITITPTRSFMTQLSTETVVHSSSVSAPVEVPEAQVVPSSTLAAVEPSMSVPVTPEPVEVEVATTETEPEVEVLTTTTERVSQSPPSVPPPVELQVSVDVVQVSETPAAQASLAPEVEEPEAVQDPVQLESVVPTTEASPSESEPTTVPSQHEELVDFLNDAGSGDSPAPVLTPVKPDKEAEAVVTSAESVVPLVSTNEEKIVIIETQPEVPATSPPEVVTTSFPDSSSDSDSDPAVVNDGEGTGEIVPSPQDEKIVIIESDPIVPATSSPEESVPTTIEPFQDEKIVVIESDPIVPATFPPEIVTTQQSSGSNTEEQASLVDGEVSDGVVDDNLVEVQAPSSSAAPAPSSNPSTNEQPTTQPSFVHDEDVVDINDTVEISKPVANSDENSEDPVPTTKFPSESVTAPALAESSAPVVEIQPPSIDLLPPVHDFKPRPEEENEIQDEVLVPEDLRQPNEPVVLSQVKPDALLAGDETHQRPSSVIFNPPLSIYLPAQDAVPTTTETPNTEAPATEGYNDGDASLNEVVFDPVLSVDAQDNGSVPTTGSSVSHSQDEIPAVYDVPVDGDNISHDDHEGLSLQDETTTVPPPIAPKEEDTIEIALADHIDDLENQDDAVPTTVLPPVVAEKIVHDSVGDDADMLATTVRPVVTVLSDDANNEPIVVAGPSGIQFDPPAEVYDGEASTTLAPEFVNDGSAHFQELADGSGAGSTDEAPVLFDSTDLPPGSKYRLDLSIFEDEEGSGAAPPETATVVEAKHDLMHADEVVATTPNPSDLVSDNVVVFDDPKVEPEKHEATTSKYDFIEELFHDEGREDGTEHPPASLSRHHHPDHVEGSGDGDSFIPVTESPVPLSRHHHPDHVDGSGSGDGVAALDDDSGSAPTTSLPPSFENDIVPVPSSSVAPAKVVKSDNLPKIPPHLVKPVAPISPDMVESFSRADHSVQSEAETEVARADESWFWRTFNKIMTLPDYLRSSRRPRRSTESDSQMLNTDKALHKKNTNVLKQLKKAAGDPSDKKYKEWSLFPRFLLW